MTEETNETKTDTETKVETESKKEVTQSETEPSKEDTKNVDNKEEDSKIIEEKEDVIEYKDFDIPKDLKINEDLLTDFTEKAKGFKLNQEQAQDLINVYTSAISKQIKSMSDEFENTQKQWIQEIKDDKEFGGINYETKNKISQNALNKLDKYGFKKMLQEYGLDKHPATIKTFHLIGKNFIEDSEIIKGQPVQEKRRTSGGNPLLSFNM